MNIQALLTHLQNHLPDLMAVYLFGSQAQGTAGSDSDVDMAVDAARAGMLKDIQEEGVVYGR